MSNAVCHTNGTPYYHMSPGWLSWNQFLIRMSYGNVIISSEWPTLLLLIYPNEKSDSDWSQHAVALQCFRSYGVCSQDVPLPLVCSVSYVGCVVAASELVCNLKAYIHWYGNKYTIARNDCASERCANAELILPSFRKPKAMLQQ